jgi:hypothetical protein
MNANIACSRIAPAGAAVNSQGRKPLDFGKENTKALEGRQTNAIATGFALTGLWFQFSRIPGAGTDR